MTIQDDSASQGNAPERVPPFLILVTGGRDYENRDAVFAALDKLHSKHPNLTVIHGACCINENRLELTGADRWAHEWSLYNERPTIAVPAQWSTHGKSAGPRRNGLMLHYLPNGVVAFPGGSGTADMCRQAEVAGVSVWRPMGAAR